MLPAMFVQQQIFAIGIGFDFDKLYIVRERIVLCCIPYQGIVDSIVALLSSFDIFEREVWGGGPPITGFGLTLVIIASRKS